MNAEPPVARFQIEHQPRRPGYARRYPTKQMTKGLKTITAICGLLSVSVFVFSFVLFGFLRTDFDFVRDFISKLGGKGQPYAFYWNALGFTAVGILLAAFGWCFGLCKSDRVLGACLMASGLGFALAAIPADFTDAQSPLSKAHFVSVCISLAGLCFGLARLAGSRSTKNDRVTANVVIALAIIPIVCASVGISAEPVSHRIILTVVFAWVLLNSIRLLTPATTTGEFVG